MGRFYTIAICLFVALGGFLFGYDTANISGVMAMDAFVKQFGRVVPTGTTAGQIFVDTDGTTYQVSSKNKSLVTSLLSIGTFGGALSGSFVADYIGRRGGIIFSALIFLGGVIVQTAVTNIGGLIAGRIITGAGVGLISMMVPMYQAEAAPPHIRGSLVSFYQLSITCGILLAQGLDLATENITSSASWRIPIGLQLAFALFIIFGCLLIPESPRYLVKRGRRDEARRNLARMRQQPEDSVAIKEEFAIILNNYEYELSLGKPTYAECFKGTMAPRTWCGILIQMFQQLTGVNFVFYYGTTFFKNAGISQPYLITLATGITNVGMTLPGIWMVERLGRRKYLIGGAAWMSLCQLIIGAVAVGQGDTTAAHRVLVGFTIMFIAGFASTWGPGAWVLISELYPLKLRGKAMSLATASNWFWNWVIAFVVPYIVDPGEGNLGPKISFIWFATSLMACIWTFFFVPETRRHSLEDLDEMFEEGLPAWKTANWKPTGAAVRGAVDLPSEHPGEKHDSASVEKQQIEEHRDAAAKESDTIAA